MCVCVCVFEGSGHELKEENKIIVKKKSNKKCPLLVTYLRVCDAEVQLEIDLPSEGGNTAVKVGMWEWHQEV